MILVSWLFGTLIGCIISVALVSGLHIHSNADAVAIGLGCGYIFGAIGVFLGRGGSRG